MSADHISLGERDPVRQAVVVIDKPMEITSDIVSGILDVLEIKAFFPQIFFSNAVVRRVYDQIIFAEFKQLLRNRIIIMYQEKTFKTKKNT